MKQYLTLKPEQMPEDAQAFAQRISEEYHLAGMEVFLDDVKPRTLPLFSDEAGKQALLMQM